MSTRKWVDKKKANTYNLVHRSHDDPLNFDEEASPSVLLEVDNLNKKELKQQRKDKWNKNADSQHSGYTLSERDAMGRRANEGEAALYGITYDDSSYDYMQHLKPMGSDPSAVFIAKRDAERRQNRKGADIMLRSTYANAEAAAPKLQLPKDILPPEELVTTTYQNQQDIPDEIAGFQPDMDPELREVLEALEDEEYVENENEDFFGDLVSSGKTTDKKNASDEWDNYEDDMEEYLALSDDESRGKNKAKKIISPPTVERRDDEEEWETAFRQFKIDQEYSKKKSAYDTDDEDEDEDEKDGLASLGGFTTMSHAMRSQNNGKKKKKNRRGGGALTEMSGLSMSSSAIHRNEGLTLLDDRFDKVEEDYEADPEEEEEEAYEPFDMKKERPDLESIMDDFLNNYAIEGKKLIKTKNLRR